MNRGRVHVWERDLDAPLGGRIVCRVEALPNLDGEGAGLCGRYVRVRNGGWLNLPRAEGEGVEPTPLGDVRADGSGDYLFEHGRGGPRVDKYTLRSEKYRRRHLEAARFGEVNTYYHLDRIASYIDQLLRALGGTSLPPVLAIVHAHHAAVVRQGIRDGEWCQGRWLPFQGGHYRLPCRRSSLREFDPVAPEGEIHLGPGRRLLTHGALFDLAGRRYRHNAAHNAGVIYHEYGHHVSRHTADFRANALAPPSRQSNVKTALDEGYCDYWAATMLGVPHLWVWHRSHLVAPLYPRSLASGRTMADFDHTRGADPHSNGTIWAAALWDLRTRLVAAASDGRRRADLLVLQSLRELGTATRGEPATRAHLRRARAGLAAGLGALLAADERLHAGAYRTEIVAAMGRRGIELPDAGGISVAPRRGPGGDADAGNGSVPEIAPESPLLLGVRRHVGADGIPESRDLVSAAALEARLAARDEPEPSVMVVGDVMLGARSSRVIAQHGTDHLFAAVAPLLRRAPILLGNLEGPFTKHAAKEPRRHSYRMRPELAPALARAGFKVMTLANNHLLDCGRAGVLETLEILSSVGVAVVGAGANRDAAHRPAILRAGPWSVGVLGYYWNRRTSATGTLPGSAMDPPEALRADITALRRLVDRVIVTFHWGIPYQRDPSPADRDKARLAAELGADAVIGHHPHVLQPFEIHRDCPIFYSVGNFTFGSGNSRAEGLLLGIRFEAHHTRTEIYPLYVKNRDPRVGYQPKAMGGEAARRCLMRLAQVSGESGARMVMDGSRGVLELPRARQAAESSRGGAGRTA